MEYIEHTLSSVYDQNSKILILGTMPSPKSRELGFYYSHPQNRFWRVLSALYEDVLPQSTEEKTAFVLRHHIALWDVLQSCRIEGADDCSIKDPVPNDITRLLRQTNISKIFTTGAKAASLYQRFCSRSAGPAVALPSTSPANCRYYNLERLIESYRVILQYA